MPILRFQDDGSIGQALGALAHGFGALNDPKAKAQAALMQAHIDASHATQAHTELQTKELQRQMDAQQAAIGATNGLLDTQYGAGAFGAGTPVTPLPDGVEGPPTPVGLTPEKQAKLAWLKQAAANSVLRGGGPVDALTAQRQLYGLAGVAMDGAPKNEDAARATQTMLTGQLPDAKTPLTEAQRGVLAREDLDQRKALEALKISHAPVDASKPWAFPQQDGSFRIFSPQQYGLGGSGFTGDTLDAQSSRIMEQTAVKIRNGAATPADVDAYDEAWNHVYGPKTEMREINGQQVPVQIQGSVPANRPHPGELRRMLGLQPGLQAQAPAAPPQAPAPAPGAPPVAQPQGGATPAPAVPPVAGQTPPAAPPQGGPAPGQAGVTQLPGAIGASKPLGTEVTTLAGLTGRAQSGHDMIGQMTKAGQIPGTINRAFSRQGAFGDGPFGEIMHDAYPSETARNWDAAATAFLDGVLRKDSGAAIGQGEYKRVENYTIPKATDAPALVEWKTRNRELILGAWKQGLLGDDPAKIVAKIDGLVAQSNPAPAPYATGAAPAQAPAGGADPLADVDAIVGIGR